MKNRHILVVFGIVLLLYAGYLGGLLYKTWPISSYSMDKAGVFGDSFGALNALFSGLAFAAVLLTLFFQQKQIQAQQFETSFFELLSLHNDIINDIDIRANGTKDVTKSGRDCFKYFRSKLKSIYEEQALLLQDRNHIDIVAVSYELFLKKYQCEVGHYFRTLYNIVKYIDVSDMENKQKYMSILRAKLSSNELLLLFYNCIHMVGSEKFKPLIEKYALLENMDYELLLSIDHLVLYKPSAFGADFQDIPSVIEELELRKNLSKTDN